MCRLAAYLGLPLRLDGFLLEPEHSLVRQAWAPRRMHGAALNADGFGVGWYDDAGEPAAYRNVLPAWADPNLPALGRSLSRPLWIANVRSATEGYGSGHANTQPFHDDRLIFLHNGFVEGFADRLRPRLRRWFRPGIEAAIHGTTDSEYLFAALRQHCLERPDVPLPEAVRAWLDRIAAWSEGSASLLNFVITDGDAVIGVRHATGGQCPSLYVAEHGGLFGAGHAVASEPFGGDGQWEPVPPHHLVILRDDGSPPQVLPL